VKRLEVIGLEGLQEVVPGDSIASLISKACAREAISLRSGDVLVIAQKIVSKAEGKIVALDKVRPSARAVELAAELGKDARVLEVILSESRSIVRIGRGAIIVETHHGFVCANAGVDLSNVGLGHVALLPADPDRSAKDIREELRRRHGVELGVLVSDSFGRAWRLGTTEVAVGASGFKPIKDLRGQTDKYGYTLKGSVTAVADEIACAAELVMGKTDGVPVALVRGCPVEPGEGTAQELIRPEAEDLFRGF
jgi:coenzyme F420-0:L-glutamate ligase/coenzyme F420-1:gamma-L-glutamate ligase